MANIAINGFGRIGRLFFRQIVEEEGIDVVAINDLGDINQLAYLLKYDTIYRKFSGTVEVKESNLVVNGKEIKVLQERDPSKLPWGELNVDVAVEATGVFAAYSKARVHLQAGAKRVVITAPSKDEDGEEGNTILMGVNEQKLRVAQMSSNGSCTTNASSPIVQVLKEAIGIEKAFLLTAHAYTATQSLVDGPARGGHMRRGRAAALNIVPSTTGAATTVTKAVEGLDGKFDGVALRVPVAAGSIANVTFIASRNTSVQEVNDALKNAAASDRWKGVLDVVEDPIVSSDILGQPYGAIADLNFTRVVDGNLVSVMSWYDNEWGYVSTLVKHVLLAAK